MSEFTDLLPRYDELYVVSDLHMGGEKSATANFQIFNQGPRLASFIRHVAKQRPGERVALVLNGDIIDALAEESVKGYVALRASEALTMIERIRNDASFREVWDELAGFVKVEGRTLVFVIGNHDIELALPPVESWIRRELTGGDAAADARIVFATRGGGFTCFVGAARVFCTHGNEVDDWNMVDYTALGLLANAMNAGREPEAERWQPNAGTRMVIDMMNEVKRRFPFVDLLKPENKPVASALLTLDPDLARRIDLGDAYAVLRDKLRGSLKKKKLLAAGRDLESVGPKLLAAEARRELMGDRLLQRIQQTQEGADEEDRLLLEAEKALAGGGSASAQARGAGTGTLHWTDLVKGWFGIVTKEEGLRLALADWLRGDKTYALGEKDDTYRDVVERVGPEIDFVVTGHTHLARAIEFAPKRNYYNSGTWIRLLRLTPQVLDDADAFKNRVYKTLELGRMDDLDEATIPGPGGETRLVFDRTNAVRITAEQGRTTGELLRVGGGANGAKLTLAPEAEAGQ